MSSASGPDPPIEVSASITLAALPRAARDARRFMVRMCQASGLPDDLCHTAALLTSELVTNAILHGRSRATLRVNQPPPCLRVEVGDHNPALPPVGLQPELSAASGRGLHIVAALASRWGISATDEGKAIWFELDLEPTD